VANDVKLRQAIKNSAINESRLLGSIGTAEMQQQLEDKIMKITKDKADFIADESGVDSSLTDDEMKKYLEKVIKEVQMNEKNA
jgi:hypothetical protein